MTPGVQIVVGALGGILVGVVAHAVGVGEGTLRVIGFPGKLYINALMLFVCPYICCTMFLSQKPDPSNANKGMAKTAITFYGITTVTAATEAVFWSQIWAPDINTVNGVCALGYECEGSMNMTELVVTDCKPACAAGEMESSGTTRTAAKLDVIVARDTTRAP